MPEEAGGPDEDDDDADVFIRAARELLRWDQARLAEVIGKHATMVRRLELGQKVPAKLREDVRRALEKAGIVFLPPTSGGGDATLGGVVLRAENEMGGRKAYRPRKAGGAVAQDGHSPPKKP